MIVPMKKITLFCLESDRDQTLDALRSLGAVHVAPVQPPAGKNLDEALATMQAEIRRVLEDGVDEEELALARRFFTGSLPLALETNDQLATYVLSREFYGLGEEYWLHDIERIESLTLQEVNDVARRVIRPESFAIVCLADFRRLGRHETQPESPGGPGGPDGRAAADGPARLLGSGQRRRPGPAASR